MIPRHHNTYYVNLWNWIKNKIYNYNEDCDSLINSSFLTATIAGIEVLQGLTFVSVSENQISLKLQHLLHDSMKLILISGCQKHHCKNQFLWFSWKVRPSVTIIKNCIMLFVSELWQTNSHKLRFWSRDWIWQLVSKLNASALLCHNSKKNYVCLYIFWSIKYFSELWILNFTNKIQLPK